MNKGISNITIIVLFLLISVSLAGILYFWSQTSLKESYPQNISSQYIATRGCIHILDANTTSVLIKNCGLLNIKKGAVYIDYIKKVEFIEEIEPQELVWINYNTISTGIHSFIIVADTATSPEFKLNVK